MKKLFSLLIFFVAFSVNAQIITNVDKLRINEITEMQEAGKILVVDSNNVVQWISEDKITPDLSDYYTKIDVDSLISVVNARVDNLSLDDVATNGNVTDNKIGVASSTIDPSIHGLKVGDGNVDGDSYNLAYFTDNINVNEHGVSGNNGLSIRLTGTADDDFPGRAVRALKSRAHIDPSGFIMTNAGGSAIGIEGAATIEGVGTVKSLVGGYFATTSLINDVNAVVENASSVYIRNPSAVDFPLNPFTRVAGLNVAEQDFKNRAVNSFNLYIGGTDTSFMRDEDIGNWSIYSISRHPSLIQGKLLVGTTDLSGSSILKLNGTAEYMSDLSAQYTDRTLVDRGYLEDRYISANVNEPTSVVTTYSGDHAELTSGSYVSLLSSNATGFPVGADGGLFSFGRSVGNISSRIFGSRSNIDGMWYSNGDPSTADIYQIASREWVNSQGFIKDLSNYYTKNESLNQFVGLSGVQNIADTKTFTSSPVVPNPTLDAHAANKVYVDKLNEPAVARFRKVGYVGQGSGAFEVVLDETMFNSTDATLTSGKVIIGSDGYYIVNITTDTKSSYNIEFFTDVLVDDTRLISSRNGKFQIIATANSGVVFLESGSVISSSIENLPSDRSVSVELSIQKI